MTAVLKDKRGFTMAELLVVVAIIAVLVAIAIPVFSSQLEKSREATDLANARSAYAEVMNAAILDDTSSELYNGSANIYQKTVPLKQKLDGWSMDAGQLVVGGISSSDSAHWLNIPRANGHCLVYYSVSNSAAYLRWGGEDHINLISAKDFLTKDILTAIVNGSYGHTVINSNEQYAQNGGTQKFVDYANAHGFNLADYGANTWQIYIKDSTGFLEKPAVYWSSVEINEGMEGKYVPVIGYRDGKYDVYRAQVVVYNRDNNDPVYASLKNNFAAVKNEGTTATFEYASYEEAKTDYDKLMAAYNSKHTVDSSDLDGIRNETISSSK